MPSMKLIRLRDFIRVKNYYFSVVGYRNEKAVKCFLRYVQHVGGDRIKNGVRFKKLSHEEAFCVEEWRRYFDGKIFRIPLDIVDEVLKPEERLLEVMDSEVKKVVQLFSSIPKDKMGVTGSRLIGLEGKDSDVDFVVYGKYWFYARELIKKGILEGRLAEPDEITWNYIYEKRKVPIPFEIFKAHERRKYHRAYIGSTYFDLLYVRDYDELNRDVPEEVGTKYGFREVEAELLDDSLIYDYPAYYPVKSTQIKAILCFTHTYVGQALKGERIFARGVLEKIGDDFYLIVGTSRETQEEFMVSVDLIEKEGLKEEFESWLKERLL
ncbi:MAG: nucleotidyltransferase domain-containing protein [Archaeoglobales archaeon]|nr:nucleotidyltransferase domain-containing protein [Archaeoglobales archaeon]